MRQKSVEQPQVRAGRGRPTSITLGITLGIILALGLFCVSECPASASAAGTANLGKKAQRVTDTAKEVAPEKLKPTLGQEQTEHNNTIVSPNNVSSSPAVTPVGLREGQAVFVPAVDDKGRQIKWSLLSSGTVLGGTSSKFHLSRAPGDWVHGTLGQMAVASGSSESFGTGSGFWQIAGEGFLRGDANGSGKIEFGDVIYLINYLFRFDAPPDPYEAGDVDCDGQVKFGDVIYLINYLFRFGPEPAC